MEREISSSRNRELATELALVEPETVMRDSVWRSIPLGVAELALIDTPPFQRLRRVQQLGFTSWIFPGAHHTRFEHSLGVFHIARRVLGQILRQPEVPEITIEDAKTLLAAALLHDIGHYPFSHAIEELELSDVRSHETISQDIIVSSPVADVLRDIWRISPERVAALLKDERLPGIDGLFEDILSGTLDVDKMDYLLRDARACNVPYGEIDVDRIVDSLQVYPTPNGPRLALNEKGTGPFSSLVFARYQMFNNVYWHHTCRICTVMLLRAVQDALLAEEISPAELERVDDGTLLGLLQHRVALNSSSSILSARLDSRSLFKRALEYAEGNENYTLLAGYKARPHLRRALEIELCDYLSAQPELNGRKLQGYEILLDIPEQKSFRVKIPILERQDEGWSLQPPERRGGLDDEAVALLQRRLRRVRVVAADRELCALIQAHEAELIQIARQTISVGK